MMDCKDCGEPMKALFTSMYCDCEDEKTHESSASRETWYGFGCSAFKCGEITLSGGYLMSQTLDGLKSYAIFDIINHYIYRVRPLSEPKRWPGDTGGGYWCPQYEILEIVEGPGIP